MSPLFKSLVLRLDCIVELTNDRTASLILVANLLFLLAILPISRAFWCGVPVVVRQKMWLKTIWYLDLAVLAAMNRNLSSSRLQRRSLHVVTFRIRRMILELTDDCLIYP